MQNCALRFRFWDAGYLGIYSVVIAGFSPFKYQGLPTSKMDFYKMYTVAKDFFNFFLKYLINIHILIYITQALKAN